MKKRADVPDPIPLYPDEATIALLVLGPKRAKDWPAKAVVLEREGLPKIDTFMGGRYWPAIEEFFRIQSGLSSTSQPTSSRVRIVPFAPDGAEDPRK